MTDRTPHESPPMRAGTKRQYFRLVRDDILTMSKRLLPVVTKPCAQVADPVSVWYLANSDPNPDPRYLPQATIIHGNKFAQHSTVNVEGAHKTCFCLQGENQKAITEITAA